MLWLQWIILLATGLSRFCQSSNVTAYLDKLLSGHERRLRPNYGESPTDVSLFVYVESLGPLQERTMDFSATFYLRMEWFNPDLMFPGENYIVFKGDDTEEFWIPDAFFVFEKEGSRHSIIQTNQMIKIYPNGTCHYLTRVSLTAVCRMVLHRFPFDEQRCSIYMMSFAYSTKDVLLHISNDTVFADDVFVGGYHLQKKSTEKIEMVLPHVGNEVRECVKIHFFFKRHLQTYLLTVYVPSLLLVIISWISFWIDAHAAPARITLGITAVMTATTMTASMQETFPAGEGVKAIDIWLAGCLMFVFLSLIEYALTNYLIVIENKKKESLKTSKDCTTPTGDKVLPSQHTDLRHRSMDGLREGIIAFEFRAEHLDKVARVAFGLGFLLFNLGYWLNYVIIKPPEEKFKVP